MGKINIGSLSVDKSYIGTDEVQKMYLGETEVYSAAPSGYTGQLFAGYNAASIFIDRTPSGTPDYVIEDQETKEVTCEAFVIVATTFGEVWDVAGTPLNCLYEAYNAGGYTGFKVIPTAQNWYFGFYNRDD